MLKTDQIKRLIEEDIASDKKRMARIGQRYYEADHDILQYRIFYYNTDGILVEDKARSNSRICHPFFTEHVDQLAAYIMSFEESPIRARETADGLQEHLDTYFDDDFWAEFQELITGCNAKGFEYLYAYKESDPTDPTRSYLKFQCADSLGVVEVRANDTDSNCEYIIYWYIEYVGLDKKKVKRIQVHDKDQIWYYNQVDDGELVPDEDVPINPQPNVILKDKKTGEYYQGKTLGFIPFWRLDNCRKQYSGLKPIKALIDDYDMMQCGLSNNLQDFDHPIHLIKGFEGTSEEEFAELQTNLKTKKILGVDADGGLDILTVDVPYQARKTKADEDEKNIYRFGMAFNSSQVGDGNITNVVIRSRYTLLDLKAKKLIKRIKQFLKAPIKAVLNEINEANGTDYQYSDVIVEFEPVIPTNEQETAQIAFTEAQTEQLRINSIMNVATYIGDEEALKAICGILDLDYDELKGQLEQLNESQNTVNAAGLLEGVVTDEQMAEAGSAAIPE